MFQALFWALSGTPFSYLPYNTPSRLKIKAFPFPRAFTAKELLFQIIWQNRPPPAQYYIPPDAPKHAPSPNKPWKRVVVTLLVGSFSLFASLSICSQTFTTTYHMICIYQVIPGASQKNPDLVTNSRPIPDHFWHLGPDPDQVRNSGPYWSHWLYDFWHRFEGNDPLYFASGRKDQHFCKISLVTLDQLWIGSTKLLSIFLFPKPTRI